MTRPRATRNVIESLVIAIVLTGLSYIVGLEVGWIKTFGSLNDWISLFAVFTSYSCTWLCVVERRINYPIGVVSSAAYAWLFARTGLVASAILNIYLVPQLAYGWWRWDRDVVTRPVTNVKIKTIPAYVVVSGVFYLGAILLNHAFNGTMAFWDGVIFAGSIVAQFMLDNKKLQNWIVWFVVDVVAIYEYFHVGLPLVGFQYILFLLNTIVGYIAWQRTKNAQKAKSVRSDDGNAANNGPLATDPILAPAM
jgi:nicotinamide mononucleotide transporter